MATSAKSTTATIVPSLRYRDAPAAIDWLCRAFGFERHLVVQGAGGTVDHAQLVFGNGMIMLGSAPADEPEPPRAGRDPTGAAGWKSPYVIVDDVDAHCDRAVAEGARLVMSPADQDYGGRLYSCRDPEGNIWNFGSYDPWE